MSELFYTCPLKAAYMAKYFSVSFKIGNNSNCTYNDFISCRWNPATKEEGENFYYISLSSLSIFKPKEFDLIRIGHHTAKPGDQLTTYHEDILPYRPFLMQTFWKPEVKEIIQRDNKSFIMPEVK